MNTIHHFLSAITLHLGKIIGDTEARAYMKIKAVDRRLSLKTIHPNTILLDVGGGWGLDDLLFAHKGANSIVVDLNNLDLKKGKEICKNLNLLDKIHYLVADARKLPFTNETFNVVTSFSAIEHLPCRDDFKVWIKEMVRVLKSGGKFVLTTSNKLWIMYPLAKILIAHKRHSHEYFFKPKEIIDVLRECNVDFETFDASVIFSQGYSFIPIPIRLGRLLENLLNKLDGFHCMRILCGRMGVRARKQFT